MQKVNGAFRSKRGFTAVDNGIVRDSKISLKAKGLYLVIQSYITIPDFTCTKAFLLSTCQEGEKAFNAAWDELKENGYLHVHFHVEKGRKGFVSEYELLDERVEGPHTFYYDADGRVTHTDVSRYHKNERTPQKGICVNGISVESMCVKRTCDEGGNNINTLSKTEDKDNTILTSTSSQPERTISLSYPDNQKERENTVHPDDKQSGLDVSGYQETIKTNIDYDLFVRINALLDKRLEKNAITLDEYESNHRNLDILEKVVRFMSDACSQTGSLIVGGKSVRAEEVRKKLLSIDHADFEEAMKQIEPRWNGMERKKSYCLTVLYNL